MRFTHAPLYGLDLEYPSQLQPELLEEYRRISIQWHEWLGFVRKDVEIMTTIRERSVAIEERPRTPRKRSREENTVEERNTECDSPESQRLKRMAKDLERLKELCKEERMLREKYKM